MADNSPIFVVDAEGWREQNAGRPAADLIREAVQNALDEAVTKLEVTLDWEAGQGVSFTIVDDVPGGIRDERLIWTIWLSDKTDSPQKRGRMGRGLKELISVSDHTLIVTAGGPAIEFERAPRGKWSRSSPRKVRPEAGTKITGRVKLWGKRDMDAIAAYLKRVRPPAGVELTVNVAPVLRSATSETYRLKLPTVVFEVQDDGSRVAREPRRECQVELFGALEDESWVYEMGIPIERIDFPLSIDVGQRVPLREKRDTLTEPYRRELFAKLLDARVAADLVPASELKDDHVMLASQAAEHLSTATKQAIANAWTGGRPYATTPQLVSQASGQHVDVVPLRSLPESIRGITREVGTDVRSVLAERLHTACATIAPCDYSVEQRRFVETWSWIAAGIGRKCQVRLATGKPSSMANFNPATRTMTVYVEIIGSRVIARPLSAEALSTLLHELSHWTSHADEHGMGFHADTDDVGGAVAAFLLEHAEEARERAGVPR